jgi:hypothetical protein
MNATLGTSQHLAHTTAVGRSADKSRPTAQKPHPTWPSTQAAFLTGSLGGSGSAGAGAAGVARLNLAAPDPGPGCGDTCEGGLVDGGTGTRGLSSTGVEGGDAGMGAGAGAGAGCGAGEGSGGRLRVEWLLDLRRLKTQR